MAKKNDPKNVAIGARLRSARKAAGFRSASSAAEQFGWPTSTYVAHENGSRTIGQDDAERYAKAFKARGAKVSAPVILFGDSQKDIVKYNEVRTEAKEMPFIDKQLATVAVTEMLVIVAKLARENRHEFDLELLAEAAELAIEAAMIEPEGNLDKHTIDSVRNDIAAQAKGFFRAERRRGGERLS